MPELTEKDTLFVEFFCIIYMQSGRKWQEQLQKLVSNVQKCRGFGLQNQWTHTSFFAKREPWKYQQNGSKLMQNGLKMASGHWSPSTEQVFGAPIVVLVWMK